MRHFQVLGSQEEITHKEIFIGQFLQIQGLRAFDPGDDEGQDLATDGGKSDGKVFLLVLVPENLSN